MLALSGLGVLVTRPETQATPLCRKLEALGAAIVRLPAIEIRPHGDRASLRASLRPLQDYELIIFLSANAVRFGVSLLDQKRDLILASVGPATRRALNQAGYRVAILPAAGFDTEGLLADPRLQNLAGKRVLLVKGLGGRELLEQTLEQRGAAVTAASVYERRRAALGDARYSEILQLFATGALHVVTATSVEIGASLVAMADTRPALQQHLQQCHWLVPSERIAVGLRELGVAAPLLVAASAEDQALVDALVRWRSSASGA